MEFGPIENPEEIDFTLPSDPPENTQILSGSGTAETELYVGYSKWNRRYLENFFPKGTNDELTYYSSQFNAVELRATFFRNFTPKQINSWYDKVPEDFRFFPKMNRKITHSKKLKEVEKTKETFLNSVVHFKDKLGTILLQLDSDFTPDQFGRLEKFLERWSPELSLAIEFQHPDWYNDSETASKVFDLLEKQDVANVIVDSAHRRDMLHMRLTNNNAFIRFVGTNNESDYKRLDEWVNRLNTWVDHGLENIQFFVHQHDNKASPHNGAHFIHKMNEVVGTELQVPNVYGEQGELFLV